MPFAHATITPEVPEGSAIQVTFNPTQYQLEKSIRLAPLPTPGLGSLPEQFVHGNGRTLSMELFFDTYAQRSDVREHTNKIYGLMDLESEPHQPAICRFRWGEGKWGLKDDNSFRCMVERVSGRFTMFLESGTPVRATLSVTFREYVDVKVQTQNANLHSVDHAKSHTVQRGESIMSIAAEEFGDARMWRPIAAVNRIDNPRRLEPGRALVIPALDEHGQPR
jgi:nucleoid-associated protein YgaU